MGAYGVCGLSQEELQPALLAAMCTPLQALSAWTQSNQVEIYTTDGYDAAMGELHLFLEATFEQLEAEAGCVAAAGLAVPPPLSYLLHEQMLRAVFAVDLDLEETQATGCERCDAM
jgi:hypothetical protein